MNDIRKATENADYPDMPQIYDSDGNGYYISEDYYQRMLDAFKVSEEKEIELEIAKELLTSHLNRLTGRQRDVMYYAMLGYSLKDTTKQMKLTVSTIQDHLDGARKKLASYIESTKKIIKESKQ